MDLAAKQVELAAFVGEQLAAIIRSALKHGMTAAQLLEETSKTLGPLIAEESASGFATAEEGLRELLNAEGGTVSLSEAAKRYKHPNGVSRQTMTEHIQNGKIIAYQSGGRGYVVPVWQFRPEGGMLPGMERVLAALREKIVGFSPAVAFTFFLQEHPLTDGASPLAALRAGKLDQVLAAVEADAR